MILCMSTSDFIYDIHLCKESEIADVIDFLNKYWKKGHALCKSKSLLDFQHKNGDFYNFIIARNKQTNEIDGLKGFIFTSQYDPVLESEGDCWGAIWKVRTDVVNPEIKTLGLYLDEVLVDEFHPKSRCGYGLSNMAIAYFKHSKGYVSGVMNHYYLLNDSIQEYKIAFLNGRVFLKHNKNSYTIREISLDDIDEVPECNYRPKKTFTYLKKRYAQHPIYNYLFWGIYSNEKLVGLWTLRRIVVEPEGVILRIIDIIGNLDKLPDLYIQLQKQLFAHSAEYIDFLNYGIAENTILNIGFAKLDLKSDDVIIPHYFEPYEKRNVNLSFAYKSDFEYVIFKGDGDQDRPNII